MSCRIPTVMSIHPSRPAAPSKTKFSVFIRLGPRPCPFSNPRSGFLCLQTLVNFLKNTRILPTNACSFQGSCNPDVAAQPRSLPRLSDFFSNNDKEQRQLPSLIWSTPITKGTLTVLQCDFRVTTGESIRRSSTGTRPPGKSYLCKGQEDSRLHYCRILIREETSNAVSLCPA